jgi:hypothetical protein
MEYVNDVNINEAVVHILDCNGEEPILNEKPLELDEDVYTFLYKHITKIFKDDDLKFAKYNAERSIVKEIVQEYLDGTTKDLVEVSKELAKQMFIIMKGNVNIPNGDLIIVSVVTDRGPMVGILKMDYIKNFTHEVNFVDEKIVVGIVPQSAGLPGSGQKIQKAAFIKPKANSDVFDMMVLDKAKQAQEDEYGANYFINTFLGATCIVNERDNTKNFLKGSETWIRKNLPDNAEKAEKIRNEFRSAVLENDSVTVEEVAGKVLDADELDNFKTYMAANCEEEFKVDKTYAEKKSKRVRISIDGGKTDLSIDAESYNNPDCFETVANGDGSINIIIKNVMNYIEK